MFCVVKSSGHAVFTAYDCAGGEGGRWGTGPGVVLWGDDGGRGCTWCCIPNDALRYVRAGISRRRTRHVYLRRDVRPYNKFALATRGRVGVSVGKPSERRLIMRCSIIKLLYRYYNVYYYHFCCIFSRPCYLSTVRTSIILLYYNLFVVVAPPPSSPLPSTIVL